jgi:predicted metal-dependent phosphoesterase TrpH
MLKSGRLDMVAVTDHNRIDFAKKLHSELGNKIIVGEEIATNEGEVIGLYLTDAIPAGLPVRECVKRIHKQGGLVYVPHPFETARKGLSLEALDSIATNVDIIETYNGRTLQNKGEQAKEWATQHTVPWASSSDAHGWRGWGNTASSIGEPPTKKNLAHLLNLAAHDTTSTGLIGRLYPKLNQLHKYRHHA